jgi:glycosyltransferase involved in cell wall biosynthesis
VRIIFANTSRIWGGNEKWTFEAAKGLLARGHKVTLVCAGELLERRARAAVIEIVRMRLRNDADLVSLFRLSLLFKTSRPECVVLTRGREYWLGGIAARVARVPLVVGRVGIERTIRRSLKDRIVFGSLLDRIIVNSSSVRRSLLGNGAPLSDKISVVYNGVRTDPPDENTRRRIRESLGVKEDELLIGTAGRLVHRKGIDIVLAAGKKLILKDDRLKLVFFGDGPLREALVAAGREDHFSGRIIVPGFAENIEECLSSLDIFVLPSRAEGISNALLEAMALGIPSITARAGGQEEAVTDGKTGFLIEKDDARALYERLLELISKPDMRTAIGKRGRDYVREKFSVDLMHEKLESLLGAGKKGGSS